VETVIPPMLQVRYSVRASNWS